MHVIVLGCGVSGLSRGIRLLEVGHTVEIRAHELPLHTIEVERVGESWMVHNYGHGGAGATLSWGCAEEVASLVAS